MRKALPLTLLLMLLFAVTARAQWRPPPPVRVPNLSGTWYLNGDSSKPCSIDQRSDGRALFTNEHGSQAWGTVYQDHVWIPDWTDGQSQGLSGTIRGNRIIWPTDSFWSR